MEFEDLIGKPYAKGGRGPRAYDCYGILMELSRRFGRQIPDYPSEGTRKELAAEILRAMDAGWETCEEEVGCAVLFRVGGVGSHVGFVVRLGWFVHCIEGQNVVMQPLNYPMWEPRIVGFYRWKGKNV